MKRRTLTGDHNQCPTCLAYFNSGFAFDKHRVGPFGSAKGPANRRCLTVPEMEKAGMALNAGGWWISERGRDGTFPVRERAKDASAGDS